MPGAGALNRRFRFEKREDTEDGYGTSKASFVHQFTVWTGVRYLRGGESVLSARLDARGPAILTVRASSNTRQIDPAWRAVDDRTGEEYAVRERPRETDDRAFLELLAESGVAA